MSAKVKNAMKYITLPGMIFGRATKISAIVHVIDPGSTIRKKSFCKRVFLNDDQLYYEVPDGTRICSFCAGHKYPTTIPEKDMALKPKPKPKHTEINPQHYQIKVNDRPVEVVDIQEALFAENMHLSHAFKYLARAGRKPTASYLTDLGKAVWWIIRGMQFKGAIHIDLPPGTYDHTLKPLK